MKKSIMYRLAALCVLSCDDLTPKQQNEIALELMSREDIELYLEHQEAKKHSKEKTE